MEAKQVPTTVVINGREHVQSDALWKGAIVRATGLFGQGPREATVACAKRGIIRCLQIHETNGHYPDIGDTYVDEITHVKNVDFPTQFNRYMLGRIGTVGAALGIEDPANPAPIEWLPFVLTDAHRAKLAKIRSAGF